MKKTLFIDTHLFDIHIVLLNDDGIINEKHIVGEKHNSKFLLPSIKEVIGKEDYNQIVVVNGPGSFTGVRLGVTIAKTLAYTQGIPIKTITSIELMDYSMNGESNTYAISDGNGYFIGKYINHKPASEYYYVSNLEFKNNIEYSKTITNVSIDYTKVLKLLESHPNENPHAVKPIYIKLIGVENDTRN